MVSYNELDSVTALLDQEANKCRKQALRDDLPWAEQERWLGDAMAYKTAADFLRQIMLTETGG